MYATTTEEAVQDAIIITGTHLIHSTLAVVLFNFGSTHTSLARAFVDKIHVMISELGHDLLVSTPSGVTLTIGVCVGGVTVIIQQHTLLNDFLVLPMGEFDVIFSMDWMTRHKMLIDCQKKKVQIHLAHGQRVTFHGRGSVKPSSLTECFMHG